MTTQRERFEAWAQVEYRNADDYTHAEYDAGFAAWQEAERQMIERCAEVCESQATHTDVRNPERVEYDPASTMAKKCASLIRALGAAT